MGDAPGTVMRLGHRFSPNVGAASSGDTPHTTSPAPAWVLPRGLQGRSTDDAPVTPSSSLHTPDTSTDPAAAPRAAASATADRGEAVGSASGAGASADGAGRCGSCGCLFLKRFQKLLRSLGNIDQTLFH